MSDDNTTTRPRRLAHPDPRDAYAAWAGQTRPKPPTLPHSGGGLPGNWDDLLVEDPRHGPLNKPRVA